MSESFEGMKTMRIDWVRRARNWLANEVIQDVPDELAACEFDCRKQHCTSDDWSSCERRLKAMEGLMVGRNSGPELSNSLRNVPRRVA